MAKFRKGTYGVNIFKFVIPKSYLKDFAKDIEISFGHFNTNSWHINNYVIDVEINQISSDNATLIQKVYKKEARRLPFKMWFLL